MKKNKIVGLIQARLSSSRLKGKMLKPVNGRTFLGIHVDRLRRSKTIDLICVATSASPKDDPIEAFCKQNNIECYRGSETDVLDRYYRAAKKFGADIVVRFCGDCTLIDPGIADEMMEEFISCGGKIDYMSNVEPLPTTYPNGMDVTIFSFEALERAWREAVNPSEREHVTFYFYNHPEKFKIKKKDLPRDLSSYRICLDYPEDEKLITSVVEELKERGIFGNMEELVGIIDEKRLNKLNEKYKFGGGWGSAFEKDGKLTAPKAEKAPALNISEGDKLWEKVIKVIPGGAQTFSKMPYQHVEGVAPKFLLRGKGCRVWDMDGNEFIDSVLGLGAIILGHCDDEVNRAFFETAGEYFNTPSLPHPLEYELAVKLNEIILGSEMVRFAKNGSDVTSAAVRLARHITGRDIIACTGYHGWHEWYIGATQRCAGVPKAVRQLTKVFGYNDFASVEKIFNDHKDNVAAVMLEPVNFDPPKDNFLQKLRDICKKNGTILIFDEVITGFRINIGGAQKYFSVIPDLTCVGKSIANGFPLSALCGKAEYMRGFKDAFFSGTFGGEIASIAAALKTIEIHKRENVSKHMTAMGEILISGFNGALKELDVPYCKCYGYGWWPKYSFDEVEGFTSFELLTLFQQELVKRGVLTRNTVFLCLSHAEPQIRQMLQAMKEALLVVKEAVSLKNVRQYLEGRVIEPVIRDENIKH